MREWLNRAVSKTVVPARVPWVRIPPSPPCNFDCRLPRADCSVRTRLQSTIANGQSAILERCRSGLTGSTGNAVYGKLYRGFESHPLRQDRSKMSEIRNRSAASYADL